MSQTREFIPLEQAQPPFFAGIDLGGSAVKIGVVDDLGRTLSWLSIPTEIEKGPADGARRMGETVLAAIEEAGLDPSDIVYAGLGVPGNIDASTGELFGAINLTGWNGFQLLRKVREHCKLPMVASNDANAAAYGEFWVGAGRDLHSIVLLTLGTGIGGGIIIGDLLVTGENGYGAECGHIVIDFSENARMCGCGHGGHLEAYASATAVVNRMREALDIGRSSSLGQRMAEGHELTPKLVAQEAEAGDALSLEIVAETARYLGIGIASLLHTIDPSGVLLGGAMTFGGRETALGRQFLSQIKHEVGRRAYRTLAERVHIDFASLDGDAGYIGAAGVARLEHRRLAGQNETGVLRHRGRHITGDLNRVIMT